MTSDPSSSQSDAAWRLARQTDVVAECGAAYLRLQNDAATVEELRPWRTLEQAGRAANDLLSEHGNAIARGLSSVAETERRYQEFLEASVVLSVELDRAGVHLAAARDQVLRAMVGEETAGGFLYEVSEALEAVNRLAG